MVELLYKKPAHGTAMKKRIHDICGLISYDIDKNPHYYLNDFVEGNLRKRKYTNRLLFLKKCRQYTHDTQ